MPKGLGKGYNDLTEEDKDQIVQMFMNKMKTVDIARKFPCTRRSIPLVLAERNIISRRKNRYTLDEHYFDEIDTEEKAYFLGLIAADGCITNVNYFALALSYPDQYILEKFASELKYTGRIYNPIHKDDRTKQYRINFSSDILTNALRSLSIEEHKQLTRNVLPDISSQLMRHYIRGLFDGDGSISLCRSTQKHGKYVYYKWRITIAGTESICRSLSELFSNQLKYSGSVKKHSSKECWYIWIHKNKAKIDLYHYMYDNATIFLTRKKDKFDHMIATLQRNL